MKTYASFTYDDPNPIKRWIQRQRFEEVLKLHEQQPDTDLATITATYSRKRIEDAQAQKNEGRKVG